MLVTALNLIIKKWKNNMLLAFIMSITMLIGIMCISTYDKLTEKTRDYDSFLKLNGGVYYFEYFNDEMFKEAVKVSPDEEHVVIEHLFAQDNNSFHLKGYDETMSKYRIPLKEGQWYTEAPKGNYVNAVITPNNTYKVGDIIHPADFFEESDPNLTIRICGITEDKFEYMDLSGYDPDNASIQSFYKLYNVHAPYAQTILFTQKDWVKDYSGFIMDGIALLGFRSKADERAVDTAAYSFAKYESMRELRESSNHVVMQKIYEVLPVFIVVLILTIICIICVVSIETSYDMKTYSILFLCGMKWRAIVVVNVIRAFLDFIIAAGMVLILKLFGMGLINKMQLLVGFGMHQLVLCALVFAVFLWTFSIVPIVMINKKMPVEVVRSVND